MGLPGRTADGRRAATNERNEVEFIAHYSRARLQAGDSEEAACMLVGLLCGDTREGLNRLRADLGVAAQDE